MSGVFSDDLRLPADRFSSLHDPAKAITIPDSYMKRQSWVVKEGRKAQP